MDIFKSFHRFLGVNVGVVKEGLYAAVPIAVLHNLDPVLRLEHEWVHVHVRHLVPETGLLAPIP